MSQQPPPPGWDQPRPQPPPPPPPAGQPYGPPGGYGYQPQPPPSRGVNGMAIASMICSVMWMYGVGSVLAIIFGSIARRQIRERGESGGAMATAGLIIGVLGLIGAVLVISLVIIGAAVDDEALRSMVA